MVVPRERARGWPYSSAPIQRLFPHIHYPSPPLFTIRCYILSPISYDPHCQIHTQSLQGSPGKEKEQNYMQSYIYIVTRLILKSLKRASPVASDHPDSGWCEGVFINPNYANIFNTSIFMLIASIIFICALLSSIIILPNAERFARYVFW